MIDLEFLRKLIVRMTITTEIAGEYRDIQDIRGEILLKKGEENPLLIGELSGYRIHSSEYSLEALDEINQDLYDVAVGVEKHMENCEKLDQMPYGNFYIIDRITIKNKYRNKGVGKCFLAQIIYNTTSHADIVFVNPQPFELKGADEDTFNKEAIRLAGYYKKLGFKKIKGSSIHYFPCESLMKLGNIGALFLSR